MWLGVLVAILYGAIAVLANFVNKYAIRVMPLPNAILLIQTVTAAVILRLMSGFGLIRLPAIRNVQVARLASLAAWYTAHALLVLCSLASLSVPMYNTLKRLTPVIVLVSKAVMDKAWPDLQTALSVVLIVAGCFVAGAGDLAFDAKGYLLALLATVAQAAYILLAEKHSHGKGAKAGGAPASSSSSSEAADVETAKGASGRNNDNDEALEPLLPPGKSGGGARDSAKGAEDSALVAPADAVPTAMAVISAPSQALGADPKGDRSQTSPLKQKQGSSPASAAAAASGSGSGSGKLAATELLYSLSVLGIPPLLVMVLATGEGGRMGPNLRALYHHMGPGNFAVWFMTMAVTNGLLNAGVILCTQLNSALTTSIVGVLKGAVSSVLGFFLLGGVKFHVVNVAGITMNMAGGVWYSALKYVRRQRALAIQRAGGGGA